MSKTWHLFVFVSLKYCSEKRLLKTHVAFFMKVTVYLPQNIQNFMLCDCRIILIYSQFMHSFYICDVVWLSGCLVPVLGGNKARERINKLKDFEKKHMALLRPNFGPINNLN
jgi:hypothetical protein